MGRSIARVVALLLLGITGALGLINGVDEWRNPYSPFQRMVYYAVVSYGVLGVIATYGVVRRARWSRRVAIAWAVTITFVSSTAGIAYGGPGVTLIAAVAAGASAALLGAFVVWAVRGA